jgi:hypothetical protein
VRVIGCPVIGIGVLDHRLGPDLRLCDHDDARADGSRGIGGDRRGHADHAG